MDAKLKKGLILSLGFVSLAAVAAPPATPPGLQDLPPGRLKTKIETLPDAAQKNALEWLNRFSIPVEDYETIDVDVDGGVFYVEPPAGEETTGEAGTATTDSLAATLSATDAFSLHSKPGASKVIFLDFDGHTIMGTAWNGSVATYEALPYDRNSDPYNFSDAELTDIAAIWHRVADDFSAFDVDVTTEDPNQFGPNTGRILITRSTDANGQAMPSSGAGGVAYVGVWGLSSYSYYQPALVYYNNLGGGAPKYVVEAASHEMGHNLGLSHDGTTTRAAYYNGQGSGYTRWAPIMGTGYNAHVSQWSKGDYQYANNNQDDIAIIQSKLSFKGDDHGNQPASATLLSIEPDGTISSTNPQNDPHNHFPQNKGIIETRSDVDVFLVNVNAGQMDLTVTPAWDAYTDNTARGANLDIQARLLDENGTVLQVSNPTDNTDAHLLTSVAAGTYYLEISGIGLGDPSTTYDDYGSQGMYFIRGLVSPSDNTNLPPRANDDQATTETGTAVTINALSNDTDPNGDVLSLVSAGPASSGSLRINGNQIEYTPEAGFIGQASFPYTIDDGHGATGTATVYITVTEKTYPPVTPQAFSVVDGQNGTAILSWQDTNLETGYDVQRETKHKKRDAWTSTVDFSGLAADTTTYTDTAGSNTYRYRVRSFNRLGASAWSDWVTVTITSGSGGGSGGGGKGGGKGRNG